MENTLKKEKTFQEKLGKLKEKPDDVDLNREIAILYIQRHQVEKAEPIREKMPDDVDLNREFGIHYLSKNDIEKAQTIIELMPDDVKLNNEFALTYLRQREVKKALPYSQKVFEKDPENTMGLIPALHMQIGLTYANMIQNSTGELAAEYGKNAVMHFQSVIEKYPDSKDNETAQYYLGVTYSITGDFDKSIEVLEKLLNHTTNDRMKQSIERAIQHVKQLAAEAESEEGAETEPEAGEDDN